jgi:hypothetical protein
MSFVCASESNLDEIIPRTKNRDKLLTFGIDYLDDAMLGIMPNDLVLIGAGSGSGKTQTCCNIAAANIANGKRVHYIALEAEMYEIERRIKYNFFAKHFFRDPLRPKININFQNWMMGDYWESCKFYEAQASEEFAEKFKTLFIFYKQGKFDIKDMIFTVTTCADETDLIIIDHVHYFDYDDSNENSSIKDIAKTARMLTLEQSKPMILVSHLRKRDRFADELCPGLEEFHGSSDLFKISTKAITLGPGASSGPGEFDTYFRVVKNRFDGGVTRYIAKATYLQKEGRYAKGYEIGTSNQKRDNGFTAIDRHLQPEWCINSTRASGSYSGMVETKRLINHARTWTKTFEDSQ